MSDELNEIWALYADEGNQALDAVEEALLALKKDASDAEAVAGLFRAMHTFKGNSRILGLAAIERRAHLAEDMIGLVRDDGVPLDQELLSLLFEAGDALRGMMEAALASRRDVDETPTAELALRMRDKYDRCKSGAGQNEAAEAVEAEIVEAEPVEAETIEGEPVKAEPAEIPAAPEETAAADWSPTPEEDFTESILFAPDPELRLSDNPTYRELLLTMTEEAVRELRGALAQPTDETGEIYAVFVQQMEALRHAADQIRMPGWPEFLQKVSTRTDASRASLEWATEQLARLCNTDLVVPDDLPDAPSPDAGREASSSTFDPAARQFLEELGPLMNRLAELGAELVLQHETDQAAVAEVSEQIRQLAQSYDYVVVADIAARFPEFCARADDFRRQQFKMYEALALIEDNSGADDIPSAVSANVILRSWCVDHLNETIFELNDRLDRLRQHESVAENCARIKELLRQTYHACRHYQVGSAGQLAWAIIDLLDHVLEEGSAPDAVVLHILSSYLSTVELLFERVDSGEAPNMAAVEELFQETSAAAFVLKGAMRASQLEVRLGLPKSFHNVLTPESCRTAAAALASGQRFYIIRADLNSDESVAERFLSWFGDGRASPITNVTVFEGDSTLFDFLISTRLDQADLAEAIGSLDPKGTCLKIQTCLSDHAHEGAGAAADGGRLGDAAVSQSAASTAAQDVMSSHMLESIGEIVTGHSMVQHMLGAFAEDDMFRAVDAQVRASGGDWSKAREGVRAYLQECHDKIERVGQIESQLLGRIDRLQEEAISVRTRSAALLLRPLTPFAESLARRLGKQVEVSISGEDASLDISMIENLKGPLRSLVSFCVTESIETPEERSVADKSVHARLRATMTRNEDNIAVVIEDDGRGIDMKRVADRCQQLGWTGEAPSLKHLLRPGYGAVTNRDGGADAIDFSEVQRSLRLKGGDLRIANLPGGGVRFHATMRLAMVVLDGMVVRVGEVMYVAPIDTVQRIVHSEASSLIKVSADDGRYLLQLSSDDVLPVQFLRSAANGAGDESGGPARRPDLQTADGTAQGAGGEEQKRLFVVVGKQSKRVALSIDELIGQQLVLIRPLQGYLSCIRGVSGCALLGSGGVGMVLDIGSVLNEG